MLAMADSPHWGCGSCSACMPNSNVGCTGSSRGTALPLVAGLAAPGALHGVADHGRFLPGVVLLDNQIRHGRAGVKIYRPFRSDDGSVLLVDLVGVRCRRIAHASGGAVAAFAVAVRGLLAPPPSAGLLLGPAFSATGEAGAGWPAGCRTTGWRARWGLQCRRYPTACEAGPGANPLATSAIWTCCRTRCRLSATWATPCSGSAGPDRAGGGRGAGAAAEARDYPVVPAVGRQPPHSWMPASGRHYRHPPTQP